MKNLLFFLWMLFAPIVEDCANYIVWKTRGLPMPVDKADGFANLMWFVTIIFVGYLLYEK